MFKALFALLVTCTLILLVAQIYKKIAQRKRVFTPQEDGGKAHPYVKSVAPIDFKRKAHIIHYKNQEYLLITGGPNDVVINHSNTPDSLKVVEEVA